MPNLNGAVGGSPELIALNTMQHIWIPQMHQQPAIIITILLLLNCLIIIIIMTALLQSFNICGALLAPSE